MNTLDCAFKMGPRNSILRALCGDVVSGDELFRDTSEWTTVGALTPAELFFMRVDHVHDAVWA